MENIELVNASKNGNSNAFSKLIKLYEKDLYRVAKGILKNDDDALDCIQDTILNAYKGIKKLSKDEYFKTWLIKILINCCNDLIRSREKLCTYIDYSNKEDNNINLERLQIDEAMEKLDEEMRLPVILYYFEDMSISDIANSLKIPEGTVKSRLSRARSKLKELIDYSGKEII